MSTLARTLAWAAVPMAFIIELWAARASDVSWPAAILIAAAATAILALVAPTHHRGTS